MQLFLWKLSQSVNNGFETYDSAVVVAPDRMSASEIHRPGTLIRERRSTDLTEVMAAGLTLPTTDPRSQPARGASQMM